MSSACAISQKKAVQEIGVRRDRGLLIADQHFGHHRFSSQLLTFQ
jgi:hypothetical protein